MSRAKRTLAIILAVLAVLIVLTPIVYVQAGKIVYARKVTAYLKQEMGYTQDEISSVQGKWTIKAPPFVVLVKFKDEPEVKYTYFAHDEVIQFSHSISDEGREAGVNEQSLKHFVPFAPY